MLLNMALVIANSDHRVITLMPCIIGFRIKLEGAGLGIGLVISKMTI